MGADRAACPGRGLTNRQRCARRVGLTALLAWLLVASAPCAAHAATIAETQAVNWAVGQIGSTSYGNLCLTFVYDAYQNGAGINLRNDTTGVTYNSDTDPQDVWGHTVTGTTGSDNDPPYGALVFFNAKAGYNPEDYSHVAIMGAGGEMISTNDAFNESNVHYETLAQEQGSGSYSTYVGWWLPDGASSGGGNPADGSFVSYQGNVYRIAGGAPLYVSNWAAVGGAQPTTPLSAAQWSALSPVPANGTVLDTTSDGVFVVAGGAPLYLSNFNAVPGSAADGVAVDNWDVENAGSGPSHLNPVPADGTVLAANGDGVYVVAGGAPLYLSNYASVPGSAGAQVTVDAWDVENAGSGPSHLNAVPSDGTVLAATGDGVYVVAGGAPLYLSNYASVPGSAGAQVTVDAWDVENAGSGPSHLNAVPADGTFLETSSGNIYRIAGGAPFAVSSWSVFGGQQPYAMVDEWDIDNITNPAAHLNAAPADGTIVEGLPSDSYWSFSGGLRTSAAAASGAVSVDDVGLAAFPLATCPAGQTGTPPNCKTPASTCPAGQTGTPPNCKTPASTCPAGQTGTPPNCKTPASTCPAGQTGTPPNCKTPKQVLLRSRCVVPNLKHMKLSTAKRALREAHCGVGTVRRPKHVRPHHVLRVISQSAVTGAQHSANYPVNLTLR